jgi:phospholipid-translocating ATPase
LDAATDLPQIFPIFGASNPGLGAVPLIVILLITAIKDAIEDYRRTVLDNELNNTPVHLLVDWHNPNVTDENISYWRQTKKATSRGLRWLVQQYKQQKQKKLLKNNPGDPLALQRSETRASVYTIASESIQMTPVSSPTPDKDIFSLKPPTSPAFDKDRFSFAPSENGIPRSNLLQVPNHPKFGGGGGAQPTTRDHGNLVDPHRQGLQKARFAKGFWKDVRVGDFVRIYNDEEIPADIVILSTSDSDGACYVETKNLDGETNLKVRHALRAGRKIRHARDCEAATFVLESENPHANLYSYSGVIKWHQRDPQDPEKFGPERQEAVSINNLLLRGCTLRNTDWAIGVVAFTGDETKIMMNAGITPSKRSRITRELNWNVSCVEICCLALLTSVRSS